VLYVRSSLLRCDEKSLPVTSADEIFVKADSRNLPEVDVFMIGEYLNNKDCFYLSHYTPWRRLEERGYRSYSFLTSALDGGEWSASRLGHVLPPEKGPPVPIVQKAGWAQSRSGHRG
jgi:hypothetical protein